MHNWIIQVTYSNFKTKRNIYYTTEDLIGIGDQSKYNVFYLIHTTNRCLIEICEDVKLYYHVMKGLCVLVYVCFDDQMWIDVISTWSNARNTQGLIIYQKYQSIQFW